MSNSSSTSSTNGTAPATDHLAQKAHETVDSAAKVSADAETRIREQAEVAAGKFRESEQRARDRVSQSVDEASAYIKTNPLMSASLAFAAGMVLSSLLRR
jgi:ElaB/YqjD/DUF883 family membrane-anchored ribosome-binding protein